MIPEFKEFASISRLSRDMVVTEKIDGTNAQVTILEDGRIFAGSRNRWLTLEDDNFGFANWVEKNKETLINGLGVGSHYGEWWGAGIQRKYGLVNDDKRFSLFNTSRWTSINNVADKPDGDTKCIEVSCCHVVPVLYRGMFDTRIVDECLEVLKQLGSAGVLGFMKPEGVVVWHEASRTLFKKTLDKNDGHKSVR